MHHSRAVEERLDYTRVSATNLYTHILNRGWGGVHSPADRLSGPVGHIALAIPADGSRLMLQAGALLSKPS